MDDEVKDKLRIYEHDSEVKQIKESHFSIFHLKQNDDETSSYQVVVEDRNLITSDYTLKYSLLNVFDLWKYISRTSTPKIPLL